MNQCWGGNGSGQLGLGDFKARGSLPTDMGDGLAEVDLGTDFFAVGVSCGLDHTCAWTYGGRVKCWGGNGYGQVRGRSGCWVVGKKMGVTRGKEVVGIMIGGLGQSTSGFPRPGKHGFFLFSRCVEVSFPSSWSISFLVFRAIFPSFRHKLALVCVRVCLCACVCTNIFSSGTHSSALRTCRTAVDLR